MKKAVIVGATGMDGHYLNRLLVANGYAVTGVSSDRIISPDGKQMPRVDITDAAQVDTFVRTVLPDEIYYLAAVHQSSENRAQQDDGTLFKKSFEVNVFGIVNFLEATRKFAPHARVFYASSSHVFGEPTSKIQDEQTPLNPVCAYGISKVAGMHVCRRYAVEHSIFVSVGILYNHESPRREPHFVSKKIVVAAAAIKNGGKGSLVLGSLDAFVDWGYAPDYVDAMHRILQTDRPDTFVVSTGELHSIQEFVEGVFGLMGLDWKSYVKVDSSLIAKKRKVPLAGNNLKLREATGWKPSVDFGGLMRILVGEEAA